MMPVYTIKVTFKKTIAVQSGNEEEAHRRAIELSIEDFWDEADTEITDISDPEIEPEDLEER